MSTLRLMPLLVLLLATLALAACAPAPAPAPGASAASASAGGAAPAAASAAASAATANASRQCLQQPASTTGAKRGDPARPQLKLTTFDCRDWDLASQRGRWVVINFWATWCGPCLQEIPDLSAFARRRQDVAVIGLDVEGGSIDAATLTDFLHKHTPGYPVAVVDPYAPPADFESPRALPTSYLIDPGGKVAAKFMGPITMSELEAMVGGKSGGGQ